VCGDAALQFQSGQSGKRPIRSGAWERAESPPADEEHEAHAVAVFQKPAGQVVAGDEPLLVQHHLHRQVQLPIAIQQDLPRLGPEALRDLIDQVAKAGAPLEVDPRTFAKDGGKGWKPYGFDIDFQNLPAESEGQPGFTRLYRNAPQLVNS